MVKLKDWFDTIGVNVLNNWNLNTTGKTIDDLLGENGASMVRNRIFQVCARLMGCAIVNEFGDWYNEYEDIDEDTIDSLNHCIQHNIPRLVNAVESLIIANDSNNGVSHNQTSANPNRNSSVMVKENTSFNKMNIQEQQNRLFQEAIEPYLDLRDELSQFVDFQVW